MQIPVADMPEEGDRALRPLCVQTLSDALHVLRHVTDRQGNIEGGKGAKILDDVFEVFADIPDRLLLAFRTGHHSIIH
ncbi:hypothetical protein D3C85_1702380 [compost metagenome]